MNIFLGLGNVQLVNIKFDGSISDSSGTSLFTP